jgi:hypothetical protein
MTFAKIMAKHFWEFLDGSTLKHVIGNRALELEAILVFRHLDPGLMQFEPALRSLEIRFNFAFV